MAAPTRTPFVAYQEDRENNLYFGFDNRILYHLPKFRGGNGENPFMHLMDFHEFCIALKPRGVLEEDFMLTYFPYSLYSYAKSWLFSLQVDSWLTWDQMRQLFVNAYSTRQLSYETTCEYFQRFKDQLESCASHVIPEHNVIFAFLEGMIPTERRMLDVLAGGSILDCYPEEVWSIVEGMNTHTNHYDFLMPTYDDHKEGTIDNAPDIGHYAQLTNDILSELTELSHPHVILESQSEPEELSSLATQTLSSDNTDESLTSNQNSSEEEQPTLAPTQMTLFNDCTEGTKTDDGEQWLNCISRPAAHYVTREVAQQVAQQAVHQAPPQAEHLAPHHMAQNTEWKQINENLESEGYVEPCKDLESMSPPLLDSLEVMPASKQIEEEEEVKIPLTSLCFEIVEQNIDIIIDDKAWESLEKVDVQSPIAANLAVNHKGLQTNERLFDKLQVHKKCHKKAKRMTTDEEKHTSFGWKPGRDLCSIAKSKTSASWHAYKHTGATTGAPTHAPASGTAQPDDALSSTKTKSHRRAKVRKRKRWRMSSNVGEYVIDPG